MLDFAFAENLPFWEGEGRPVANSVEHHSYAAQLIPDTLTDVRYVEVTLGKVPECHFVIAVEHTKQSCSAASPTLMLQSLHF